MQLSNSHLQSDSLLAFAKHVSRIQVDSTGDVTQTLIPGRSEPLITMILLFPVSDVILYKHCIVLYAYMVFLWIDTKFFISSTHVLHIGVQIRKHI